MKIIKKASKIDGSVNWIIPYKNSYIECRYIRREPDYVSTYLSSHNGCKMGCKFCWLTASEQINFNHLPISVYVCQLNKILEHAVTIDKENSPNIRVNVNLMSRGEPMANKYIVNEYDTFHNEIENAIKKFNYGQMKMNISTIMPTTLTNRKLFDIFHDKPVNMYYSLYSVKDKFRKFWLPNAMDHELALDKLREYQEKTNNTITFHFALIEGQNDDPSDIDEMIKSIKERKFTQTKMNLVRFNPHPFTRYEEPSIEKLIEIHQKLQSACNDVNINTHKSRIVPRAGSDVYASCGMFYDDM